MQRYLIIAAAMLVAVTLTTAVQADIIDQDNTVVSGGGGGTISIDFSRSQTVTVGVSGQLSRIGLQVQRGSKATDNLNIRLLGTTGGSPDGSNVLATSFLTPSDISVGPGVGSVPVVFVDFLADGLTFSAGDMFAIELSSDAPLRLPLAPDTFG